MWGCNLVFLPARLDLFLGTHISWACSEPLREGPGQEHAAVGRGGEGVSRPRDRLPVASGEEQGAAVPLAASG